MNAAAAVLCTLGAYWVGRALRARSREWLVLGEHGVVWGTGRTIDGAVVGVEEAAMPRAAADRIARHEATRTGRAHWVVELAEVYRVGEGGEGEWAGVPA